MTKLYRQRLRCVFIREASRLDPRSIMALCLYDDRLNQGAKNDTLAEWWEQVIRGDMGVSMSSAGK